MAAAIEGYASHTSVVAGDFVDFHVRATAGHSHFTMEISRRGATDELLKSVDGDAFVPGPQDDATLAIAGCGWPAVASCRTAIPPQWRSGYYVAKLKTGNESAEIPFFIRSATPGTTAPVLLKMSDTTAQAYTGWGGRGLYTTPFASHISFDRPYDDMSLFERYQIPFIRWAEKNNVALDYCSALDLHRDPHLLAPYEALISLGHDEYWSLEMRDQVEAFIAGGGNVAFLSANTCYWQIRLDMSEGRRTMICYKETENNPPDPERTDSRRVTVRWYEAPVSRPENFLTGVSYRNGAGWWIDPTVPQQRFRGYTVSNAAHWLFAGTGLSDGDVFGNGTSVDDTILGYETDAALLAGNDPPVVSGSDGTPRDFAVLATADLSDWTAHGQGGQATLGTYRRNGIVVTVGTVNWAGGLPLDGSGNAVATITENILRRLTGAKPGQLPVANGGFEDWSNGAPSGWALDGAGSVDPVATDPDALANALRFAAPGGTSMHVDGTPGETWISCSSLTLDGSKTYGAGCWMNASSPGATIRLQTTDSWTDIAQAGHSGSGAWEYVFALTAPGDDRTDIPARVKIQVAAGVEAVVDGVSVIVYDD